MAKTMKAPPGGGASRKKRMSAAEKAEQADLAAAAEMARATVNLTGIVHLGVWMHEFHEHVPRKGKYRRGRIWA